MSSIRPNSHEDCRIIHIVLVVISWLFGLAVVAVRAFRIPIMSIFSALQSFTLGFLPLCLAVESMKDGVPVVLLLLVIFSAINLLLVIIMFVLEKKFTKAQEAELEEKKKDAAGEEEDLFQVISGGDDMVEEKKESTHADDARDASPTSNPLAVGHSQPSANEELENGSSRHGDNTQQEEAGSEAEPSTKEEPSREEHQNGDTQQEVPEEPLQVDAGEHEVPEEPEPSVSVAAGPMPSDPADEPLQETPTVPHDG